MSLEMQNIANESRQMGELSGKAARFGLIVGGAGVVVALVLAMSADGWAHFFRAYIAAYTYVLSISLGALAFVLLQHVTRAGWSVVVRRIAEMTASAMPLLAILFIPVLIPILLGMPGVYPWASGDEVAHDSLLQWKQPYLNLPFFLLRCLIYFGVWIWLARFYARTSIAQDSNGDPQLTRRMEKLSAVGLVLYALTVTFFSIDVIKSLAPHWFSTIFGVYYFSGAMVGFFAFLALLLIWLQWCGRVRASITTEHYHDLGKLVFAFVVFWAYIAYSQYMLIWYGNIPEETMWYEARQSDPWWVGVSLVLLAGHFVVPFLMLISRIPKRSRGLLLMGSVWVLLIHWVDLYYLVMPIAHHSAADAAHGGHGEHVAAGLRGTDISLWIGLAGLFVYAVMSQMGRASLVPARDPRLTESLAFENI